MERPFADRAPLGVTKFKGTCRRHLVPCATMTADEASSTGTATGSTSKSPDKSQGRSIYDDFLFPAKLSCARLQHSETSGIALPEPQNHDIVQPWLFSGLASAVQQRLSQQVWAALRGSSEADKASRDVDDEADEAEDDGAGRVHRQEPTVPPSLVDRHPLEAQLKDLASSLNGSAQLGYDAFSSVPWDKLAPLAELAARFAPLLLLQAARPALASLLGSASAGYSTVAGSALPLSLAGVGSLPTQAGIATAAHVLSTHVGLFSLTAAIMFIMSIRGLNKHSTSKEGNLIGMLATALGILSILVSPGFNGAHLRFLVTFLTAGAVGYVAASQVSMEEMPQLIAGFHSFVGLAAVAAGFASFCHLEPFSALKALETVVGTAVGMLTFTGSVVAAGKLHGIIPGRPIIIPGRWLWNIGGLAASAALTTLFCTPAVHASSLGVVYLGLNTTIWAGLGANMVLPIGGADMPVVVSLLNAFSGLATSAMGFMLSNNLLSITGALVSSSGFLLSDIMCRGINRSMTNVLLGGFGVEDGGPSRDAAAGGPVSEVSSANFVGTLLSAKRVVIVPGYGLAVARCQGRLAEIVAMLREHGVLVHFAIHPVAGRLPGHMNVLLAEADVPYDIVKEMEQIGPNLPEFDVAIVVGANDIVNPATQEDPSSPIYGMPAIKVWECKTCVVLKRSMATGYSGVDNPLFYRPNVKMLFGDAKQSLDAVYHLLDAHNRSGWDTIDSVSLVASSRRSTSEEESYPTPCKVVGVIRERREGEQRVSVAPSVVPALRRMGFSLMLEAGAGVAAGFSDEDYTRCGEVRIVESAMEVLQEAHVILKVNEPLQDEVQLLMGGQVMIGLWDMRGTEALMMALRQSQATFVNLALVPRVSRAQKLDALTSMANIAGYRAVLDAFSRLPRFSRSSVTACGAMPPARVFVIGAGVAGLSAIATAHAMGAQVFANDVRDAAREQVESLGAEFVPVDAHGIAGEGSGGYATAMDDAFHKAQLRTYAQQLPSMDVVITTAMIPNAAAPLLITEQAVGTMRRGSVIVDLAAQTGGNCALTSPSEVVISANGVAVVGETNYPSTMAAQASELLGNNFAALLEVLGGAEELGGPDGVNWDDPIVKPAAVVHNGVVAWPPPPRPTLPPQPNIEAQPAAIAQQPQTLQPPQEASALVQWLQDHQHELSLGVGGAVVLGLGLGTNIPDQELTQMGYWVLSLLIGHFTVAGVTPALHTPLIAVTNAISGIIVVGGMLQLSGPLLSARVAFALAAVFLSSVNIAGGFAVTQRMLEMFREDKRRIQTS